MLYKYAKGLKPGDEVIVKKTGLVLYVVCVTYDAKNIIVTCSDGRKYRHKDIK